MTSHFYHINLYVFKHLGSHHADGVGDDFIDALFNPNVGGSGGVNNDNDTAELILS
jgi:hypothetical protein